MHRKNAATTMNIPEHNKTPIMSFLCSDSLASVSALGRIELPTHWTLLHCSLISMGIGTPTRTKSLLQTVRLMTIPFLFSCGQE
jgi:hypothetical protein